MMVNEHDKYVRLKVQWDIIYRYVEKESKLLGHELGDEYFEGYTSACGKIKRMMEITIPGDKEGE